MKPLVIGISGPSSSGKSTLAAMCKDRLEECVILQQDCFFIDPTLCPPDANFCDPRYLKLKDFITAAQAVCTGNSVEVPLIDFTTFRTAGMITLRPAPYVIVEGMTIYRIPEVDSLFDLRFYLAPPFSIIETRKRLRDSTQRNKTISVIEAQLHWMLAEYDSDLKTFEEKVVMVREASLENVATLILERIRAVQR